MIYLPLIATLGMVGPGIALIAILRVLSPRWHLRLLGICIFYGISPLLLAWSGQNLAERFNCQLNIIVYRCPLPTWYGEIFTGMIFSHWLALITIPSASLGIIGILVSLISQINKLRTKTKSSQQTTIIFYRSRHHKVFAGICGGIAQRWNLRIQDVRIFTIILASFILGLFLLYFWAWFAFPLEPLIESHFKTHLFSSPIILIHKREIHEMAISDPSLPRYYLLGFCRKCLSSN